MRKAMILPTLVCTTVLWAGVDQCHAADNREAKPGTPPSEKTLPKKEKFHLVVLAGQSNMVGVSPVEPQDKRPHPRVLMLSDAGEWVPAVDPLHSAPGSGVCLGRSF